MLTLDGIASACTFAGCVRQTGCVHERDWIGGFDFPFGLPRELVRDLGWPTDWLACMRSYASLSRPQIRDCFAAFCAARRPVAASLRTARPTAGPVRVRR